MQNMIEVQRLSKVFTLHNQGGIQLPVLQGISFSAQAGECTALFGDSGSGKSTLLRSLYANYLPSAGSIHIRHRGAMVELTAAPNRQVLEIRRETIGYVSQFLRVIPRVPTLEVVMQPLRERGVSETQARQRAGALLERLHIPSRLWSLPPGTFSGGEQQRVNIARGFAADYPILLLDEPTASLDRGNAQVVIELVREVLANGVAVVGIFHDAEARAALANRIFNVNSRPDPRGAEAAGDRSPA